MVYNSAKTAVTVTPDYSSPSLKSSNYESSVVTITAAGRTKALNIEGNSKANKIIGTSGGDTISGAAGNDTLTGGDGADVFIFDGKGTDVVTDYTSGEDTLKISSGSVGTYSISAARTPRSKSAAAQSKFPAARTKPLPLLIPKTLSKPTTAG